MNEKASPSIVKLVAVLAVICIIVSAVLGGVNMVTFQRIEDIQTEKTNAAFNAVLPTDGGYTEVEYSGNAAIEGVYEADAGHVVQLTIGGAQSTSRWRWASITAASFPACPSSSTARLRAWARKPPRIRSVTSTSAFPAPRL